MICPRCEGKTTEHFTGFVVSEPCQGKWFRVVLSLIVVPTFLKEIIKKNEKEDLGHTKKRWVY